MPSRPYDDDAVLSQYLWHNYAQLFTEPQRAVMNALIGEAKAQYSDNPRYAAKVRSMFGSVRDPEVAKSLAAGEKQWRQQASQWLLANHSAEVFVNRCPQCTRIVRTPVARQCFWCGHSWHGQR